MCAVPTGSWGLTSWRTGPSSQGARVGALLLTTLSGCRQYPAGGATSNVNSENLRNEHGQTWNRQRALGVHEGPQEMVALADHRRDELVGTLLLFAQGSALAPFIYSLF
jgi:hypothetical protein